VICVETLAKLADKGDNSVLIAKAGEIPPLVALLKNGTAVAKTALLLGILAVGNEDNRVAIARASAIPALVLLLQKGNDIMQVVAANTLQVFSCDDRQSEESQGAPQDL